MASHTSPDVLLSTFMSFRPKVASNRTSALSPEVGGEAVSCPFRPWAGLCCSCCSSGVSAIAFSSLSSLLPSRVDGCTASGGSVSCTLPSRRSLLRGRSAALSFSAIAAAVSSFLSRSLVLFRVLSSSLDVRLSSYRLQGCALVILKGRESGSSILVAFPVVVWRRGAHDATR